MGKQLKCRCGNLIDPELASAADTIACPACGRHWKVRRRAPSPPPSPRICPWCKHPLAADAVVCTACGLDFRLGWRVNVSPLVPARPQAPEDKFLFRFLHCYLGIDLTRKQVIWMGIGATLLLMLGFVYLSRRSPIAIYEIRPVDVFTALDRIHPYAIFLPLEENKHVQIGFSSQPTMNTGAVDFLQSLHDRSVKKLLFFQPSDQGGYLLVRLGISQKFLTEQNSADSTQLYLEDNNVQLKVDNQTLSPLILDYEYAAPKVLAELITAWDFEQFLPPGFVPQAGQKTGREEANQEVVYRQAVREKNAPNPGGSGTLSGRVTIQRERAPVSRLRTGESDYTSLTLAEERGDDQVFAAYGNLSYETPGGMAVKYTYNNVFLTLTWDNATQCRKAVTRAWEARFILDSSKWELFVLFPRPPAGSRDMQLKVFGRTFPVPDKYAAGSS